MRESKALISPATEYSVIPKVGAYRLGYPEAARDDPVTEPPNLFRGVGCGGYWEGRLISMKEVTIGRMSRVNVDFIAYDVPQVAGFDVILGMSFRASSGIAIDYSTNTVRTEIERVAR